MINTLAKIVTVIVSLLILILAIRGNPGNPRETDLGTPEWKDNGPFELSPERGRYALVYSIVENHTYHLSPYLAAFVAPDVAVSNDYFVSLFPPGLTYTLMPGYLLGRTFNLAQIGATATIALMALVNMYLIYRLAIKFDAHPLAALLASITFLFATPAFTYAATIYQHHLTTLIILMSIMIVTSPPRWITSAILWLLAGYAFLVDAPNPVFLAPSLVFWFVQLFRVRVTPTKTYLDWSLARTTALFALAIPLALLIKFNLDSFGSPWKLAGTNQRATAIRLEVNAATGLPVAVSETVDQYDGHRKSVGGFFKTRTLMNGLYTHFAAIDRGIVFFAPVILIGIMGFGQVLRKKKIPATLILITIAVIVLLYSMWGDPYGGWAFGSRYLIPAYALMAPFVAVALTHYARSFAFLTLYYIGFVYSVVINTVGVLTTSAIPPRIQLAAIREQVGLPIADGYLNNFTLLHSGMSKSYIYTTFLRNILSAWDLGVLIVGALSLVAGIFVLILYLRRDHADFN